MATLSPMADPAARSGPLNDRPRVRYGGDDTNSVNSSGQTRIGGPGRLVDKAGNPIATPGSQQASSAGAGAGAAPAPMQPPPAPGGQMVPGRSAGSMVFKPNDPSQKQGQLVPGRSAGSMVWQQPSSSPTSAPGSAPYPGSRGAAAPGVPGAATAAGASSTPPAPASSPAVPRSAAAPQPAASPAAPRPISPPVGSPSAPLTPQQMKDRAAQQAQQPPQQPASPAPSPSPSPSAPGAPAPKPKNFEGYPSLEAWKAAQEKQRGPLTAGTPPSGPVKIDPNKPQPMAPPSPGAKNFEGHPSLESWKAAQDSARSEAASRARGKMAAQQSAKTAPKPESTPGHLTPEDAAIFRKGNQQAAIMSDSEIALRRRAEGLPESAESAPAGSSSPESKDSPMRVPEPGGKIIQKDANGDMVEVRHPEPGKLPEGSHLTVINGQLVQVTPLNKGPGPGAPPPGSKPKKFNDPQLTAWKAAHAAKAGNPQAPPSPIQPPKAASSSTKPKTGAMLRLPGSIIS